MFSAIDHTHMAEALRLAARGRSTTAPNPRVGCVIADGTGVLGQGSHERAGGPHAEVLALREAGARARGATAYVTLEPCAHHGRTPPCADALVRAGVARVVAAVGDPFDRVAGEGFARLRAAGIAVEVGLMESAAREINVGFFSRIERGRPFVRVKLASTLDGRTAPADGSRLAVTTDAAQRDGHRWRARASAILTGVDTVLADDPLLTVRLDVPHAPPLRVIADTGLRTPPTARLLSEAGPHVLVVCGDGADGGRRRALEAAGAEVVALPLDGAHIDLRALLLLLAQRQVNELHVEAGASLAGGLLRAGMLDECLLYQSHTLLGADARPLFGGTLTAMLDWTLIDERRTGPDRRLILRPKQGD
ncbi:MAG: bifunctional diaminohydroxyphosphoribosylaminopyrimidine deaminase/5-amino-6-(5-phosphoribosylamino)uracil reductase RibD [Xanthomonadales bacterium]|nr:bifunctional diaminohydroxyphosphoribosylaminopyrimidine deaminase/5-amino-6-(5-phosphoribosylamino)uracil reductase RibD [Xanthomonadales bacterium]